MPAWGRLSLIFVVAVAATVVLVLSVLVTNPLAIGPIGVTAWFLVLFVMLAAWLTIGLYALKSYFHLHDNPAGRLRYSRRQGMLLAGWIAGILALSSLDQLGVRDAILLGLLLGIIEVYVRFRWP